MTVAQTDSESSVTFLGRPQHQLDHHENHRLVVLDEEEQNLLLQQRQRGFLQRQLTNDTSSASSQDDGEDIVVDDDDHRDADHHDLVVRIQAPSAPAVATGPIHNTTPTSNVPFPEIVPLVGRASEFQSLRDAWNRVIRQRRRQSSSCHDDSTTDERVAEVVLVHGESGVGKSGLVETMREPVVVESSGMFVSGKFDQLCLQKEPFHAIICALSELCDFFLVIQQQEQQQQQQEQQSKKKRKAKPKNKDHNHLGRRLTSRMSQSEWNTFVQFLPSEVNRLFQYDEEDDDCPYQSKSILQQDPSYDGCYYSSSPLDEYHHNTTTTSSSTMDSFHHLQRIHSTTEYSTTESFVQLKQACRIFLEVASEFRPILFFLDDVQWADEDSMSLIQTFLQSPSRNILYVIAFRDGYGGTGYDDSSNNKGLPHSLFIPTDDEYVIHSQETLLDDEEEDNPANNTTNAISAHHERSQRSSPPNIRMTDVYLQNLGLQDVYEMVQRIGLFDYDPQEQSQHIARLLYEKSHGGNPCAVLQFCELLKTQGLLRFSKENALWEWVRFPQIARMDIVSSSSKDNTNNMVPSAAATTVITTRIQQELSHDAQSVLVTAAHLGFEFRRDVLAAVLLDIPGNDPLQSSSSAITAALSTVETRIEMALLEAEQQSLIITAGGRDPNLICFMHDRVRECLYEMIPEGVEKEQMNLRVGMQLATYRPDLIENEHSILFMVVENLNLGRHHMTDQVQKLHLVEWNRRGAQQASMLGSFSTTVSYLNIAIDLLSGFDMWNNHYELALDLHNALTQAACNCGQTEVCQWVHEEVTEHVRDILDAQATLQTRIWASENEEAISMALTSIQGLGLNCLSKEPAWSAIMKRLLHIKWLMRNRKPEDLSRLPVMEDKRLIAIQGLLHTVAMRAHLSGLQNLAILSVLEMFSMCLVHGQSSTMPTAVAIYASLETVRFNHVKEGVALARQAMTMVQESASTKELAFTIMMCHTFVLHFHEPIRDSFGALDLGFEAGIASGQPYLAIGNWGTLVALFLWSGIPLGQAEAAMRSRCRRMKDFVSESNTILLSSRCFWQCTLNLLGINKNRRQDAGSGSNSITNGNVDPLLLNGDAMNEEDLLLSVTEDDYTSLQFHMCKLTLAVHFGATREAARVVKVLEKFKVRRGVVTTAHYLFLSCLTYIDMYREMIAAKIKAEKKETANEGDWNGESRRGILSKIWKAYRALESRVSYGCRCSIALFGIAQAEMQSIPGLVVPSPITKTRKPSLSGLKSMASKMTSFNRNSTKKLKEKVNTDLYDSGIEAALAEGFTGVASIGCERAGRALQRLRDEKRAREVNEGEAAASSSRGLIQFDDDVSVILMYDYFQRGLDLALGWEALAKARWYKREYMSEVEAILVDSSASSPPYFRRDMNSDCSDMTEFEIQSIEIIPDDHDNDGK